LAGVALVLNTFNLLPFSMLDGGRFLESVFSRRQHFDFVIKILMGLAQAGYAWLTRSFFWGITAFGTLAASQKSYTLGKIAGRLMRKWKDKIPVSLESIPREYLEAILSELHGSGLAKPDESAKTIANWARIVWHKVCRRPPGLKISGVLLAGYLFAFVVGIGGSAVFGKDWLNNAPYLEPVKDIVESKVKQITTAFR
jgi:membrane-associated protease RseP (regulator of RpoE activity)